MTSQQLVQKKYYQMIMPGHYLDVRYDQTNWKMAKIIDKNKRYLYVSFDGYQNQEQQIFINSYRVAPLRVNTEGYTGSSLKISRYVIPKICQLKNYLQIANQKFFDEQKANPFEITQLLRGQLFVYVHDLLSKQNYLNQSEVKDSNFFLVNFVDLVIKIAKKSISYAPQYFSTSNIKLQYLVNAKTALLCSLQQLLILLNFIFKIDTYKLIQIIMQLNKQQISHQVFLNYFTQKDGLKIFIEIFNFTDGNGKWYPSSIRKSIYKMMLRLGKIILPKYFLKDYNEVFSIYPFMIELKSSQAIEKQFVQFTVNLLVQNSPFDSKLRAIQQLRKMLQGNFRLEFYDQTKILEVIMNKGVVDFLLHQKNFNPQIFKRFVPILNIICKGKSLSLKQINSLFKIIEHRHQSQMQIIFQIICKITQFAPSSLLDNIYNEILKIDMNNEQTIKFIKNFTLKAVQNLSKQKSGIMGWFTKKKVSAKHGYYGLALLYNQSLDAGLISKDKVLFTLQALKQMFQNIYFHSQRQNFMQNCIASIQKSKRQIIVEKNLGQNLKLLIHIIRTFEQYSILSQDQRKVVEKLDTKFNLLDIILENFKNKQKIDFSKISFQDFQKYFYQFLQSFSQYLKNPLNIKQIQFLWMMKDNQLLFEYLRKSKSKDQKYKKLIGSQKIEDILKDIISKNSFYKHVLTIKQFQVLHELYVSYHLQKKNLYLPNKQGLLRFNKITLLGYSLYIQFSLYANNDQRLFQKVIQKGLQSILRPHDQIPAQKRAYVWKKYFNDYFLKLKVNPKRCLVFIQMFFSLIQGRMFKQISLTDQTYIEISVKYLSNESKISLQRNSTIFRLRKLITTKFQIKTDFIMFNVKMNKPITFQEEQDFSVNAMPTVDKGPSIIIQFGDKPIHYHQECVKIFKGLVQNDEQFYDEIFKLGQQPNVQIMFWKLIQSLPINKSMLNKVQKCQKFIKKNWQQFFDTQYDDSLQYKLNIILTLIKKSDTWGTKMFDTKGLQVVIQLFLKRIQDQSFKQINSPLLQKIMTIILHCYELCDRKQLGEQKLLQMNKSIILLISKFFDSPKQNQKVLILSQENQKEKQIIQNEKNNQDQIKISLNLLNKILDLYLRNSKFINKNNSDIVALTLQNFVKILHFGLFQKKSEASNKFSQEISVSITFTLFDSLQTRTFILQHFMNKFNLQFFQIHPNCQNFFKYLITVLHTFNKEDEQNQSAKCLNYHFQTLLSFITAVINSQIQDVSTVQSNKILNGALKILQFVLSKLQGKQFDYENMFKSIVQNFLFNEDLSKNTKRIKSQKNKKLIYQIIKKMCFTDSKLVNILVFKIQHFLQNNQWRKNNMLNWNLHLQKTDKKLFCGIQNLGATCYMNCLFQQLFMIKQFRDKFVSIDSKIYKEKLQQNQMYQLQNIFSRLKYSNRKSVNTKKFCDSYISYEGTCINPMVQSDADQFFNSLMEKVQIFLKFFNEHKILQDTFEGKLSNQLICQGCPHRSQKIQNFLSIGVNLKNKKTLQEALKGYVEGQILDGDNAYFCQQCQKKVRTTKRLCIKQLPNILVIVLKRFQYNFDEFKKIKINSFLQFPEKLDMQYYLSDYFAQKNESEKMEKQQQKKKEDYNFRLRGTVIHAGTSQAGHYYSFINQKGKWYEFNDEMIDQITYKKVQQDGFGGQQKSLDEFKMQKFKNAYILFYQKESYAKTKQNSKVYSQIQSQYSVQLKKNITTDNYNANLFSVLLDPNFIRLWQNLSILQNQRISQFLFLYFHTAILRDKFRHEYAPNYFRILMNMLDKKQTCQWFLNQINRPYIRQFLIQAPKIIRHLCLSFVIKVLKTVQKIPNQLLQFFFGSIRRFGMTPFAKVFRILSQNGQNQKFLLQKQYEKLILNILLDDKYEIQLKPSILLQSESKTTSYFGCDSSDHELQKQKCSSGMLQSLQNFQVSQIDIFKLNEKYSSRQANKVLAHLLLKSYKKLQGEDCQQKIKTAISNHILFYQQNIVKFGFRKDQVEKYVFYLREISQSQYKVDKIIIVQSLKKYIFNSQCLYDATDLILRQINKMAKRNNQFAHVWRENVKKDESFQKILRIWLKEAEKPHLMTNNQDYKRKVSNMSQSQRDVYKKQNSQLLQLRIRWMIDSSSQNEEKNSMICEDILDYPSDLQEQANKQITIRNKTVMIKQKFKYATICKVQCEKVQRWAILQKNEIQLYNNL